MAKLRSRPSACSTCAPMYRAMSRSKTAHVQLQNVMSPCVRKLIFERPELENANEFGRVARGKTVLQTVSLQHMCSNVSCDVALQNRAFLRSLNFHSPAHTLSCFQSDFVRTLGQLHCQDFSRNIVRQMFVSLWSPPMVSTTYLGCKRRSHCSHPPRVHGLGC